MSSVCKFSKYCLLLSFLLLSISGLKAEEKVAPGKQGNLELERDRAGSPAKLYIPTDYNPAKKWPLIICMHGMGGKPTFSPWKEILQGKGYIIAGLNYADIPFSTSGFSKGAYDGNNESDKVVRTYIRAAIEKIASSYNVDRSEIIYAGDSMGGWNIGTFCCTSDMADVFRGYIGWGCRPHAWRDANFSLTKGKPIMIYHGETCFVLKEQPVEEDMQAIARAGMNLTRIVYPGQGHGVSNGVCGDDIRKWFNEIRLEDQLAGGFSPVEWKSGSLSGTLANKTPEAVAAYLKDQEFFKSRSEGKPLLIWCYTDESQTSRGKTKPSRESVKSDKAFSKLFVYPEAVDTIGNSRYFDCVSISLNGISKKENPVFNSSSAPFIVLISGDGEAVTLLNSTPTDKSLSAKMNALLTDEQKKEVAQRTAGFSTVRKEWKGLYKDYQKNQDKLLKAFKSLPYNDKRILSLKEKLSQTLHEFSKLCDSLSGAETVAK